ncbi:MAG: hypothetical protein WD335_03605 [Candidatus Paceibacterota bacterium]
MEGFLNVVRAVILTFTSAGGLYLLLYITIQLAGRDDGEFGLAVTVPTSLVLLLISYLLLQTF